MILFFVDDRVEIIFKEKVKSYKLDGVLLKGFIIDKNRFIEEFGKVLKKEKIRSKLFGDSIAIVKNLYFNYAYRCFLDSVFGDLGFIKVNYMDIKELMPEMDATFVEINESYMVIGINEGIYLDLDYFKNIPGVFNYFKGMFLKDIVLFGVNKNIPNIKIINKKLYYVDDYAHYITNSLLKVKKYGA